MVQSETYTMFVWLNSQKVYQSGQKVKVAKRSTLSSVNFDSPIESESMLVFRPLYNCMIVELK